MPTWWWSAPGTTAWWPRCCSPAPGSTCVVLEAADVIGGAARTEAPFPEVPGLRPLHRRLPARADAAGAARDAGRRPPGAAPRPALLPAHAPATRYLLFGPTASAMRAQFATFFSARGLAADDALQRRSSPRCATTSRPPGWRSRSPSRRPPSATSGPQLREAFVDLCRGSVADYLDRFGFQSELLKACTRSPTGCPGFTPAPGHAGHRAQLPGPQHVPAARLATAPG